MGLERDEGLGLAFVADLLGVAGHRLTIDRAARVLAGDGAASASAAVIGRSARSTFTFSSRTAVASKLVGGSIATSASSWSMWFWTMSRSAPELVVIIAAALEPDRLGDGDLDVVDVRAFHNGSNSRLANRSASRFWTVSLPR